MRNFRDAKAMAKTLRQLLDERSVAVSLADCLEMVARQFGCRDWNVLSAAIEGGPGPDLTLPDGWFRSGSKPEHYDMGVEAGGRGMEAVIRCRFEAGDSLLAKAEQGFGTLMQSVLADAFRGRTLRFAAELAAERIDGAGTIWMRVDRGKGQTIRFDNMEERSSGGPVRGTASWAAREIVLDVPDDASTLHYGFYLRGTGTLRVRNLAFGDAPAETVPTAKRDRYLPAPKNLDFSLASGPTARRDPPSPQP